VRTVGWECGWSSVCEDVLLERVKTEKHQYAVIILSESVTPNLCRIRLVIYYE
jgi:hypothetical protein